MESSLCSHQPSTCSSQDPQNAEIKYNKLIYPDHERESYNIQIYLPNISTGQNLAWDQVPHWGKKERNRRGREKKSRGSLGREKGGPFLPPSLRSPIFTYFSYLTPFFAFPPCEPGPRLHKTSLHQGPEKLSKNRIIGTVFKIMQI